MKKLLIAAAIVCAAALSQAASTDWKVTSGKMKDHTGTTAFSGLFELYAKGGDLASPLLVYSNDSAGTTLSNVPFSVDIWEKAGDPIGLTPEVSYTFYYKLTDADGWTLTSADKTGLKALGTGTQGVLFNDQSGYTGNTGNWTAPAPEPTSGLLLLLGVAGLALKRKRA